jgi:hypothetical protein
MNKDIGFWMGLLLRATFNPFPGSHPQIIKLKKKKKKKKEFLPVGILQ